MQLFSFCFTESVLYSLYLEKQPPFISFYMLVDNLMTCRLHFSLFFFLAKAIPTKRVFDEDRLTGLTDGID